MNISCSRYVGCLLVPSREGVVDMLLGFLANSNRGTQMSQLMFERRFTALPIVHQKSHTDECFNGALEALAWFKCSAGISLQSSLFQSSFGRQKITFTTHSHELKAVHECDDRCVL